MREARYLRSLNVRYGKNSKLAWNDLFRQKICFCRLIFGGNDFGIGCFQKRGFIVAQFHHKRLWLRGLDLFTLELLLRIFQIFRLKWLRELEAFRAESTQKPCKIKRGADKCT